MSRVFICAADRDLPLAGQVADQLKKRDIPCLFPGGEKAGNGVVGRVFLGGVFAGAAASDFGKNKDKQLKNTLAVVVVSSDDSENDLTVAEHINAAKAEGIKTIELRAVADGAKGGKGRRTADFFIEFYEPEIEKAVDDAIRAMETIEGFAEHGADQKSGFRLPGYTGNRFVSLTVTVYYIAAALLLLMTYLALVSSRKIVEDAAFAVYLTIALGTPVLLLGNFAGLRKKLPIFKTKRPLPTMAAVIALEVALYLLFNLLIYLMSNYWV